MAYKTNAQQQQSQPSVYNTSTEKKLFSFRFQPNWAHNHVRWRENRCMRDRFQGSFFLPSDCLAIYFKFLNIFPRMNFCEAKCAQHV